MPDHRLRRCCRHSSVSPRPVTRRRRRSGSPSRCLRRSGDRRSTGVSRWRLWHRRQLPMPHRSSHHCCRCRRRQWQRGPRHRRPQQSSLRQPRPPDVVRRARHVEILCEHRSECCETSYSVSNSTNFQSPRDHWSRSLQIRNRLESPPPEHVRANRTAWRTPVPHRTARVVRTSCACGRRWRTPRCGDSRACEAGSSTRRPNPTGSGPIANSRGGRLWPPSAHRDSSRRDLACGERASNSARVSRRAHRPGRHRPIPDAPRARERGDPARRGQRPPNVRAMPILRGRSPRRLRGGRIRSPRQASPRPGSRLVQRACASWFAGTPRVATPNTATASIDRVRATARVSRRRYRRRPAPCRRHRDDPTAWPSPCRTAPARTGRRSRREHSCRRTRSRPRGVHRS